MHNSPESITYLIKVQHTVVINNKECSYDEIIAQCTDLDRAIDLATASNGRVEKLTESAHDSSDDTQE
jgi:hypothetical protein